MQQDLPLHLQMRPNSFHRPVHAGQDLRHRHHPDKLVQSTKTKEDILQGGRPEPPWHAVCFGLDQGPSAAAALAEPSSSDDEAPLLCGVTGCMAPIVRGLHAQSRSWSAERRSSSRYSTPACLLHHLSSTGPYQDRLLATPHPCAEDVLNFFPPSILMDK
ncbi:unnamed protein product, partial [Cladocopium goreaui]